MFMLFIGPIIGVAVSIIATVVIVSSVGVSRQRIRFR